MSKREIYLLAVIILLIGLLLGLFLGGAFSDDDGDTEAAGEVPSSTTTSAAPTTTTTETPTTTTASTTTTSTTSTTTTTTSTTTTTTTAPPLSPLADVVAGEVVGFEFGAPFADVLAEMTARYGAPDNDTGWSDNCILDGGPNDTDRVLMWGNFRVNFTRWEGPEVLAGWIYERGQAGNFDTSGPLPEDILFPPGAGWNLTLDELAGSLGVDAQVWDDFGFAIANGPHNGHYRVTYSANTSDFFNYASINPMDLCD